MATKLPEKTESKAAVVIKAATRPGDRIEMKARVSAVAKALGLGLSNRKLARKLEDLDWDESALLSWLGTIDQRKQDKQELREDQALNEIFSDHTWHNIEQEYEDAEYSDRQAREKTLKKFWMSVPTVARLMTTEALDDETCTCLTKLLFEIFRDNMPLWNEYFQDDKKRTMAHHYAVIQTLEGK